MVTDWTELRGCVSSTEWASTVQRCGSSSLFHSVGPDKLHCLLLCPSLCSIPNLAPVYPKKSQRHLFRQWLILNLSLRGDTGCLDCILWRSLSEANVGSTSRLQRNCVGRLPNGYACALLWAIFHRFHDNRSVSYDSLSRTLAIRSTSSTVSRPLSRSMERTRLCLAL
jgi:hypothetical protein